MTASRPICLSGAARSTQTQAQVRSPYDGSALVPVDLAGKAEAEEAAEKASQGFKEYSQSSTGQRRDLLLAIARGIQARSEEFAQAICQEAGKPIAQARQEVSRAVQTFSWAAGEAERFGGELIPVDLSPATAGYQCLVRRVPRGPVLAIGPFNFPLNLIAHKVAPALAVGATVVVKPPPQAPGAALLLGELIAKLSADTWPSGLVSVLPCENDVAQALVEDERFAILSFTGSGQVGWKLKSLAGRKHSILELGGDAAVVVSPSAPIEEAARRIAYGANTYAGQVCIAVQRILVHESVKKAFTEALLREYAALSLGDPAQEETVLGPVIDDGAAERLEELVAQAGGQRLYGGSRKGRVLQPTLIEAPNASSPLSHDEVFGPVAGLWEYRDFEDALATVNASAYGLQAGLFSNDLGEVFQAHNTLQVGGLMVNEIPTFRLDNYPYGGSKASGLGREGGRAGLLEMSEERVLVINPQTSRA